MKCCSWISNWNLFCSYFYIFLFTLSRESSISNIQEIIYKISCTLKTSSAMISNNTQGYCLCYTPPAPFTWNETKSFACRLSNSQNKIQVLSGCISVIVLNDKGKIYFLFQRNRNEEQMCVKHCKCKSGVCCQLKSLSSKRSGSFKKALEYELNLNVIFFPIVSACVCCSQHRGYALSIIQFK